MEELSCEPWGWTSYRIYSWQDSEEHAGATFYQGNFVQIYRRGTDLWRVKCKSWFWARPADSGAAGQSASGKDPRTFHGLRVN